MQIYSFRPSFPAPFLPLPEKCPFLYLKSGESLTYVEVRLLPPLR